MKNNIFIIGFSGVGKTTVGLAFAKANKKNFVSQDYIVERIVGMNIKKYQDKNGFQKTKMAFENVLKELIMGCSNTVIDCGGGTSNTENLKNQVVVYLRASKELILSRYKNDDKNDKNRFAKYLSENEFLNIFEKKEKEYLENATYIVDVLDTDSVEDVVSKIEKLDIKE